MAKCQLLRSHSGGFGEFSRILNNHSWRMSCSLRPSASRNCRSFRRLWRGQSTDLGMGIDLQAHALTRDEPDGDQVFFDHAANRGKDRWNVFALHPRPAARVEHGLQSLRPRRTHRPPRRNTAEIIRVSATVQAKCSMFLELMNTSNGAAPGMHDIVDGDIDRVLAVRPFELVGLRLRSSCGRSSGLGDVDRPSAALGARLPAGFSRVRR